MTTCRGDVSNQDNLRYIESQLGSDYVIATNSEIRYKCPECQRLGKTYEDYKMYVNVDKGLYWCHRCQYSGYLLEDKLRKNSDVYNSLEYVIHELTSTDDCTPGSFKIPTKKLVPNDPVYDYAISRGLSPRDIRYYRMCTGSLIRPEEDVFVNRLVIPNQVRDGLTDMYVARSIDPYDYRRYLNPRSSKSNDAVFNLFRIPQTPDRIVIQEGVINAVVAGRDSVATYGKYVSRGQLLQILSKDPKEIVISLDYDALDISYELAGRIKKVDSSIRVKIVHLPEGVDASDLGREVYNSEYVDKSEEYYSRLTYHINKFVGVRSVN